MTKSISFSRRLVVLTSLMLACVVSGLLLASPAPAAAGSITSNGFTTSASAPSSTVVVGQPVGINVWVKSIANRSALVDVEIYDGSGQKVFQRYWDSQTFTAGVTREFSTSWASTTTAGTYVVKIGIFGVGWSSFIHWNDSAMTIRLTTQGATTTSTTAPSTTASNTSGRFTTLPPGSSLPSGADCAARVRRTTEIRPENYTANHNRGSRANANTRTDWSGFIRVDGNFVGTTDEIIQWAACKWGIDEDIVRAQAIKESYWYQSNVGDNGDSFGITQVRQSAHPSAFQFSINAKNSTAYNLDYTYASWRACYEGAYTWLNSVEHNGTYKAGDVWGCVGLWFSGRWYVNTDAYLNQIGDSVRWHYDNKTWLTATFING
jgi:autotransporter family porin